jgi:hypothetical protein
MVWTDGGGPYARALERWRETANLVSNRWAACLEAEDATRRWAFASYLAALDAESAPTDGR